MEIVAVIAVLVALVVLALALFHLGKLMLGYSLARRLDSGITHYRGLCRQALVGDEWRVEWTFRNGHAVFERSGFFGIPGFRDCRAAIKEIDPLVIDDYMASWSDMPGLLKAVEEADKALYR